MSRLISFLVAIGMVLAPAASSQVVEPAADLAARLQLLSSNGNAEASYHLGMIYHLGLEGVTPDPRRAFDYFRRAAEGGDPLGAYKLGCFYAGQGESVVQADHELALRYKLRAAEAGYSLAQLDVARIYDDRGDQDLAVRWIEAAARQGDMSAMMAALSYRSPHGARPDAARAWLYYELVLRKAASMAAEIAPNEPAPSREEFAAPLREMIGQLNEDGRAAGQQLLEAWREERSAVTRRADLGLEAARQLAS